jgi:hypothetical protein
LISTIEAETPAELRESPEESSGKNRTGNGNSDEAVIHKNVVVEQSYEYVK